MTSDEYPAYATAIEEIFGEPVPAPPYREPGQPRVVPERRLPDDVVYATVHKHRENNRVIAVEQRQIFGSREGLEDVLGESAASHQVNTSFVERQNGTDRHRNARKARKSYRFSKDWGFHEAATYFTLYSYNFCWPVRTLRVTDERGRWRERTPAIAAGLTDHVWSMSEWLTMPPCNDPGPRRKSHLPLKRSLGKMPHPWASLPVGGVLPNSIYAREALLPMSIGSKAIREI
jgi:hypothetical protein